VHRRRLRWDRRRRCPLKREMDGTELLMSSDVNKDWTCKDTDQAYKDQDKDKD